MAETDECAQRACLRMAEVTVIHSVVTRATGSTAMGILVDVDITVGKDCQTSGMREEEEEEGKDGQASFGPFWQQLFSGGRPKRTSGVSPLGHRLW